MRYLTKWEHIQWIIFIKLESVFTIVNIHPTRIQILIQLLPPCQNRLRVPPGCSTELNHAGYSFLTGLFERHDRDKDGALSPAETLSLFSTCPSVAWDEKLPTTVRTDEKGYVTLSGFLAQWTLWTLLDVNKTLAYLAYFGFCAKYHHNQLAAITVTREKRLDLAKKASVRSVYQCHVIGPPGGGKTTFCQGLLGRTLQEVSELEETTTSRHTIDTLQVYGQEKYLVLHDIDVHNISDALMPNEVQCDVACLIYDVSSPTSFEYIARIYMKYFSESQIPVLIVANKQDGAKVWQRYISQPEQFCLQHKLPPPHPYSSRTPKRDIYTKLATMAAYPRFQAAWMLFYKSRQLQQLRLAVCGDGKGWVRIGLGVAAATAIVFIFTRAFKNSVDNAR